MRMFLPYILMAISSLGEGGIESAGSVSTGAVGYSGGVFDPTALYRIDSSIVLVDDLTVALFVWTEPGLVAPIIPTSVDLVFYDSQEAEIANVKGVQVKTISPALWYAAPAVVVGGTSTIKDQARSVQVSIAKGLRLETDVRGVGGTISWYLSVAPVSYPICPNCVQAYVCSCTTSAPLGCPPPPAVKPTCTLPPQP